MSDLEKLRAWIATYPDFDILGQLQCDFTDQMPANGGIFPSGLVELGRTEDILGNVTVENQYNFGLYCVFEKSKGDDIGATINADWVMGFQRWVQEQSIRNLAPVFGNVDTKREKILAQNGMMYETDNEGTAMYMIQLSVKFKYLYEVT